MIISWQMTRDLKVAILKIDQSAFIRDLLDEKNLVKCNFIKISMKTGSVIKINDMTNYEETDIKAYQQLVGKLMYLSCSIRFNILFVMG